MSNKWVEVEAKTIDDAIKAGLKELSLEDATQANINILREPEGGVFGVGGTKALVRISVRNGLKNNNKDGNSRGGNSRSCLLYTSPSPRDQRGARMPSSA